jgi:hypothetical protein
LRLRDRFIDAVHAEDVMVDDALCEIEYPERMSHYLNGLASNVSTSQSQEIQMKKSLIVSTFFIAGLIGSPALVHAQTNPSTGTTNSTTTTNRDDNTNWGWLGLLGLAGLIGL